MWMSVLAVALLNLPSAQPSNLKVVNDRLTYGHLGPSREAAPQYLPGDVIHLAFEMSNMTFDANGKAGYSIDLDILDSKGTELLKQQPRSATALNYLGGTTMPCAANLQVPLESPPGTYTFRVTVVDAASKKSASVVRKFEVLPKGFGLVQVGTSADGAANIPWSPVGVVGDSIYLNFSAVGFARDKVSKQPNIKVSMRVLDDRDQPVAGAKMLGAASSGVPADLQVVPMQFGITLNRVGRFTLELTATDSLTGNTTKVSFPVRVLGP